MSLFNSERMKVYIQTDDGTTYDFSGYVKSITMSQGWDALTNIGLELLVTEDGLDHSRVDMSAVKSAKEWKCPHCQSINLRKMRECEKCAAPRPFIYE